MKFKKLRFKNFLSYGNAFTEFDLDTNLTTLITGVNGHGKTALMEAFYFAISGKPYRDINKPQLINQINKKELLVEVEFEHNNHEYLIKRGIKPDIFELFKDGKLIDKDAATKDYQKMLESIIGIDADTFGNTIFISSKNYKPFMKLTPVERRNFIENILNIKIFSDILEQTKIKRSIHVEKHNSIEFNLKNTNDKLNIAKESNEKYAKNNEDEIANIKEQIKKECEEVKPIEDELTRIESYLDKNKFNEQIESINLDIKKLEKESEKEQKLVDDKNIIKSKSLYEQLDNINSYRAEIIGKIATLNISLNTFTNEKNNITTASLNAIESIKKETVNFIKNATNEINNSIKLKNSEINIAKQDIAFYEHNQECPTCKQAISKDSTIISNHLERLNKEIEDNLKEIESMQSGHDAEMKSIAENSYVLIANSKAEYDKKKESTTQKIKEIEDNIYNLETSLPHIDIELIDIKNNINKLETEKSTNINEIKDKYKALIVDKTYELEKPNSSLKLANDRMKLLNDKKLVINTKISSLNKRLEELNSTEKKELIDIKPFESDIVRIQQEKIDSEYHKETLEIMIKMLGDKGLKSYIVKKYIPTINELTNKYLEIFSASYRVSFDETFAMKIHSKGYENLDYGSLSSGEEQRTDLSLLFAFHELGKIKSSINTNILMLDEISDKSLDSDGLNGLFAIFDTMKRNKQTIFNISHRPEVRDRFDKAYRVNKLRFSNVEEI